MADKINIQDAAKLLNIDVERLQFLSRTGEIHGKQEDNGTVFTYDELRRYADSTGIEIGEAPLDSLDLSDDDDSILVDEPPVSPTEGGSGTVIDDAPGTSPDSSDLNLGDSIELELELDDSDELSLDLEEGDLDPEDKTLFAEGGDEGLSASDLAALSLDLDDEDQIAPEDDTQFGAGGDDSGLEFDEVLNLDLGGSSDDETQFAIGNEGFKVAEDEIVLGGEENILTSEESSDIGLAAGNSGINITSPHDSGISLEGGALDLAGGSGSSLELPGADEEFMLGGSPEDEMSDSGSQVIALSDSMQFGEDSATMVQPDAGFPAADPLQGPADPFALPQDGGAVDPFAQPMGAAMDPFAMPADAMAGAAPAADPMQPQPEPEMVGADVLALPAVQEANYGFFNVFSLFMIFLMQIFILGMLIDLIKNLWGHHAETPSNLSKTTMEAAIGLKDGEHAWLILSIAAGIFFIAIIVGWIVDRARSK